MMDSRPRPVWPWLAAIVLAGFAARLVNSDSGLWYDEVVTLVKSVRPPLGQVLTSCTDFNNHMLYTIAAKASVSAFGDSAWALRLPAILFGTAAIAALFWFAAKLLDRTGAVLAALLLAFASHAVWFSQNARGYTGLLFFGLIGTGLFVEGLRNPLPRTWIAYGFVSAAAIWTHLTAGFAIAAQGIVYLAVLARRHPRRDAPDAPASPGAAPLLGFAIALVFGLAIYAAIIPQMVHEFGKQAGMASQNVKVAEWTSPFWTVKEALLRSGLGSSAVAVLLAAALLAALGFLSLARREPAAVAAMVLPAPIALVVLEAASFHIWPRYFFPLAGFALVFVVRGVQVACDRIAGRLGPRVATAAIVLAAGASVALLMRDWSLPKQDYEGARDFVTANRSPGDAVVTVGLATHPYAWLYAPEWTPVEGPEALDGMVAAAPKTWLVYSFPKVLATSDPAILERIRARFVEVRVFPGSVGDGDVRVCRSR